VKHGREEGGLVGSRETCFPMLLNMGSNAMG
jgi:hypothetical protein